MKSSEMFPAFPFDVYRYLDDNTLVKGTVSKIHFFEEGHTLVGVPDIKYDEGSCCRPLTTIERCSVPYASALCMSLEEARCARLKHLNMMAEVYEHNKAECVQSFLTTYERYVDSIRKTTLHISELNKISNV